MSPGLTLEDISVGLNVVAEGPEFRLSRGQCRSLSSITPSLNFEETLKGLEERGVRQVSARHSTRWYALRTPGKFAAGR